MKRLILAAHSLPVHVTWQEALRQPVVNKPPFAVPHWVLLLNDPDQVPRVNPDVQHVRWQEQLVGLVQLGRRILATEQRPNVGGLWYLI